jgi:membrane-associated protein
MNAIADFLRSLYNAERLLELARTLLSSPLGLAGLFGIIFSETGLLVGFFLPGDSLLFSVGFASGAAGVNLYLLGGILMCAAIIGDNVGYFLGRQSGPRIFRRPESRFFVPAPQPPPKKFLKN